MATLNWPGFGLAAISPTLDQPSQSNSSAWTGTRTVIANPWHGKWSFRVALATRQGDAAFQAARAFFTSLKGQINTFHLPAVEAPQNGNTGVTLSANAAQGATSIALTGVTTALVAGNMVTIAGQLLSLTSVGSLSGTAQTLNFQPSLRAAASSGASVETAKPYALVYLADSKFTWDIGSWRRYGLTFDATEAVGETDGADPTLDVWGGGTGGSGGGGAMFSFPQLPSFISRSLLAAVTSPSDKQVAYLTEAGREGVFVFSTANLSASVTADPYQGRYIAPAANTTGALGAWVRNHSTATVSSEPVAVAQQFYEATDSSFGQAIQRALDHLRATGINGGGPDAYRGSAALMITPGDFTSNIPIDIYHSLDIGGPGGGGDGPNAYGVAHIKFLGCSGFRIQFPTTYGDSSVDLTLARGGVGRARLHDLMLTSDQTVAGTHAIIARSIATVEDIYARDWRGLALRSWTGSFRGASYSGNTSTSEYNRIKGENCDGTLSIGGTDSNLIQTNTIQGYQNKRFGAEDSNAAGANNHRGHHHTYNGFNPYSGGPYVMCSQSGNIYTPNLACVDFTSPSNTNTILNAHAPSGTTAHTAYWLYVHAGGPTASAPAYTSSGNWAYGGDMLATTPFATVWDSCYMEGGGLLSQSLNNQVEWRGGTLDLTQVYGGTLVTVTDTGFEIMRQGLMELLLRSAGGNVLISAYDFAGTLMGYLNWVEGGATALSAGTELDISTAGVLRSTFASYGLAFAGTGQALYNNGNKVLGERQTGTPADATDLATALTLVNALKAKLIAHGAIS